MKITELAIPDVRLIEPTRHPDARGLFCETYNREQLAEAGLVTEFVQDNHSISQAAGTIRGLHFQAPPFAQDKLVRVIRGAIFDVAVDIRKASPSYGRHVSHTLSAGNWLQMFVPVGFAHGFCTLEPETEVIYKVSAPYAPEHDFGLFWDDPELGIDWPVKNSQAVLSDRDRVLPELGSIASPF